MQVKSCNYHVEGIVITHCIVITLLYLQGHCKVSPLTSPVALA